MQQDKDGDRRDKDEKSKSRSRSRSRSRNTRKSGGGSEDQDTEDIKFIKIEFSEGWEEAMGKKFAAAGLKRSLWSMEGFDCDGNPFSFDSPEVQLSVESFPLKFKFTRK